jgi:hypothetical protein
MINETNKGVCSNQFTINELGMVAGTIGLIYYFYNRNTKNLKPFIQTPKISFPKVPLVYKRT